MYMTLNKKTCQNRNQPQITTFRTQIIFTKFSVILLLFPINTAQKYNGQKARLFSTKTSNGYKPTDDDFFLHPNHPHIIFRHFLVVSHQYG